MFLRHMGKQRVRELVGVLTLECLLAARAPQYEIVHGHQPPRPIKVDVALYLPRSDHAFYRPCVIPVANWFLGRRTGHGLTLTEVCTYTAAQVLGAVGGSVLANAMFEVGTSISGKDRATGGHQLAEVVATAGLLALVFALVRTGRGAIAAPAVGAYIGAAYWFTSFTSFANPAVTVGRILSDTFAGIAPASAVLFIAAQLLGLAVGIAVTLALYPDVSDTVDDVVIPHTANTASRRTP